MKYAIIVERDSDICEMLKTIMEEDGGWKVDCVKSIHSARSLLYSRHYHLIIMDHYISKTEGGVELLLDHEPRTIILSTFKDAEKEYTTLNARVLFKPFSIDEFMGLLEQ